MTANISERMSRLHQKKVELSEAKRQEELILQEAEKRRQQNSIGSGETPPPLPSVPPPASTPSPPSNTTPVPSASAESGAEQRLDMLLGGGVLKSNNSGPGHQSNGTKPEKRVSFITEARPMMAEEEDLDEDELAGGDFVVGGEVGEDGAGVGVRSTHNVERMKKLEKAKDDPNVSCGDNK